MPTNVLVFLIISVTGGDSGAYYFIVVVYRVAASRGSLLGAAPFLRSGGGMANAIIHSRKKEAGKRVKGRRKGKLKYWRLLEHEDGLVILYEPGGRDMGHRGDVARATFERLG